MATVAGVGVEAQSDLGRHDLRRQGGRLPSGVAALERAMVPHGQQRDTEQPLSSPMQRLELASLEGGSPRLDQEDRPVAVHGYAWPSLGDAVEQAHAGGVLSREVGQERLSSSDRSAEQLSGLHPASPMRPIAPSPRASAR